MEHEDVARNEYLELASESYDKFSCTATGLHVNPCYPHLGATPDGLIECDSCGESVLKVKCPNKHRDKHPHDAVVDSQFCLRKNDDGTAHLCCDHEHYNQGFKGNLPYVKRNTVTLIAGHLTVST